MASKSSKQREARRAALEADLQARRISLTSMPGEKASWIAKFITSIVNNIEVTVEGISVRYEDEISDSCLSMKCGFETKRFLVETTDENFDPIPFNAELVKLHKLVTVDSLQIYWQSRVREVDHIKEDSKSEFENGQSPFTDDDVLLSPVMVTGKLTLRREAIITQNISEAGGMERDPRVKATVEVDGLHVSLRPNVIRDSRIIAGAFALHYARASRLERRPAVRSYRGHYAEWWRYAMQEVVMHVRGRRFRLESMVTCARNAKEYAELFRRHLNVLPLPRLAEAEHARMLQLEAESSDEFVSAVRGRVHQSVEAQARELLERSRADAMPRRGYFQRLYSGLGQAFGTGAEEQQVQIGGVQVSLTPEQMQELERFFDADASTGDEQEGCNAEVLCWLQASVGEVSFNLWMSQALRTDTGDLWKSIAALTLSRCSMSTALRRDGFCFGASLSSLAVLGSTFGCLVCPLQNAPYVVAVERYDEILESNGSFVTLHVEHGRIHQNQIGYKVRAQVKPVIVSIFPEWLKEVSAWFNSAADGQGKTSSVSVNAFVATRHSARGMSRLVSSALTDAWLTHTTVDLNCIFESSTVRLISQSVQLHSDQSEPTLSTSPARSMAEVRLGRLEISGGKECGYVGNEEQSDVFELAISGFGVKVGAVIHGGTLTDAEVTGINPIVGPVSCNVKINIAPKPPLPPAARTNIQAKVWHTQFRISNDQCLHLSELIKAIRHSCKGAREIRVDRARPQHPKSTEPIRQRATSEERLPVANVELRNEAKSTCPKMENCEEAKRSKLINFELQLRDPFSLELFEAENQESLLILIADDFSACVAVRSISIELDLKLKVLEIQDLLVQRFTSDRSTGTNFGNVSTKQMQYMLRQRDSQTSNTVPMNSFLGAKLWIVESQSLDTHSLDIQGEIHLGFMEVNLCLQTIEALHTWFSNSMGSARRMKSSIKPTTSWSSDAGEVLSSSGLQSISIQKDSLRTDFCMEGFQISLMQKSGNHIFEFIKAEFWTPHLSLLVSDTLSLSFTLSDLMVIDPMTRAQSGSSNNQILSSLKSCRESRMLRIDFKYRNPIQNSTLPELSVVCEGFSFYFSSAFITNAVLYLNSLNDFCTSSKSRVLSSSPTDSFSKQAELLWSFRLDCCEIFVPNQPASRHETGIIFKLCRVEAGNSDSEIFKAKLKLQVLVKATACSTCEILTTSAVVGCTTSSVERDWTCSVPVLTIICQMNSIQICFSEQQSTFIIDTVFRLLDEIDSIFNGLSIDLNDFVESDEKDSTLTTPRNSLAKCCTVEVDKLLIIFREKMSHPRRKQTITDSDELHFQVKEIFLEMRNPPNGNKEAKLTIQTIAIEFITAKDNFFSKVLVIFPNYFY